MTGSTVTARNVGETVSAVTRAFNDLANAMPWRMDIHERSEPSVGIRMCLYMASSLLLSRVRDNDVRAFGSTTRIHPADLTQQIGFGHDAYQTPAVDDRQRSDPLCHHEMSS